MMIRSDMVRSSAMYIGYLMLDGICKNSNNKISIYDLSELLKKKGIKSSRQMIIGLTFLYSVGIIEFEEANIWAKK